MKKTQQNLIKILCIIVLFQLSGILTAQQIYVNREWRTNYGDPVFNPLLSPYGGDWTKSIVTATNDIVTVGHTAISGQGENLLISRYSQNGSLIWQTNYNSSSTFNDYGIDLIEDASGNIYVCGVTDNGGITNSDIIVLMYDSNGSLQNSTIFDGPNSMNDISSAIKIDGNGNILVSGAMEDPTNGYDYLIVSYDASLNFNWKNNYDYANLYDFAASLEIDNGKIMVGGASASSSTDWDYAVAYFDPSNGSYQGDTRDNLPGVGFDEIYAFKKDAAGNTYATGKASTNGINYDIRTLKISPTNTIVWAQSYDAFGSEDIGSSIAIDTNGNVIVGGFITKSNNKKDLIILKYDSNGTLLWQHNQPSNDPNSDAIVKAIDLNPSNNIIYFIGGEKESNGNKRSIVGKIDPNGNIGWQRFIKGNYDYLPSDILYGGYGTPGIFAITIKDSTINRYELSFFTEHQMDTAKIYTSNGTPKYLARTLIVRLDTSALAFNKIDDIEYRAGSIEDFLKPAAVASIQANLATICENDRCDIKVYKIFPYLTSSMNKTISRLGDTVNIPQFYSALLFEFPTNVNLASAANSLNTLEPLVKYSHPDHIFKPDGGIAKESMIPYAENYSNRTNSINDPEYSNQKGIHFVSPFDSAHVNTEPAWNYTTGKAHIKVGVFDSGIDWNHEDFGDGTASGSKMIAGWDFNFTGSNLKNNQNADVAGHGSAVAGIIGAIRNNNKGIAGIAGGNYNASYPLDSSGVSLYGLKIYGQYSQSGFFTDSLIHYVYDAIVNSSINDSSLQYGYGLHVMNNSWGIKNIDQAYFLDTNITLLTEAVHFANRCKVTFVASRGNTYPYPNNINYPAIIDDDWVLCVGGSGTSGWYNDGTHPYENISDLPMKGNNKKEIDVSAPYTYTLTRTVGAGPSNTTYVNFNATSCSAPHVSGAVGLLMSYLNLPYAAPSNLAPEDCEAILQLSAHDTDFPGCDTLTGWGRLDIGKALQIVDKSKYKLSHYGSITNSNTRTKTVEPQVLVKLMERYQNFSGDWFAPKYYQLTPYKITATINHNLPSFDTIKASWPRASSSDLLDEISNGQIYPRERVKIDTINLSNAVLHGYVYQVKDSLGTTDLGWWPYDSTQYNGKFAYSILRYDTTSAIGVKEQIKNNNTVSIYPNPTNNVQILNINTYEAEPLQIDLFDVTGRYIFNVYTGKTNAGSNKYSANLSKFDCGLYFYRIRIKEEERVFKVIKQ